MNMYVCMYVCMLFPPVARILLNYGLSPASTRLLPEGVGSTQTEVVLPAPPQPSSEGPRDPPGGPIPAIPC